jgi:4-amino-4-deoxy-L-arabinose transferase-like glycosyltransferase
MPYLSLLKTKLESLGSLSNGSLVLAFIIFCAALMRSTAVFHDLPPYLFCDENIFSGESFAMLQSGQLLTQEFKAGGINIYVPLLIAKVIVLFSDFANFSYADYVILGRVIFLLVINPLTIIFIYLSAIELFQKKSVGLFASLAYLISPFLLANSRIWYPDHYIGFFSAGLFYFLIKNYKEPAQAINYPLIGIFLSLTISTKYTGLLLVPVVGILLLTNLFWKGSNKQCISSVNYRLIIKFLFSAAFSSLVVLLIVNASALADLPKFIYDFNYNIENYRKNGTLNVNGIFFYLFVLYYLPLGGFGLTSIALGYRDIYLQHPRLIFLLLAPIAFATYLGISGLVLFRNMTIFLPLIFLIAGVGLDRLYQFSVSKNWTLKVVGVLLLIGIGSSQLAQVALTIKRDFDADSRILAENWLKNNLLGASIVGTNQFCSGPSPAKVAGLQTKIDPSMSENFDYYVFDTYWDGFFRPAYTSRGVLQEWDQKYLHYYFFNQTKMFRWEIKTIEPNHLVPAGYSILQWFKSNGPDILILKRN